MGEKVKVSSDEVAGLILWSSIPFLLSTSAGAGAPSERQLKVTWRPSTSSSSGLINSDVFLGGSEKELDQEFNKAGSGKKWELQKKHKNKHLQWTCRWMLVLLDLHKSPPSCSRSALQVSTWWSSSTRWWRLKETFCKTLEKLNDFSATVLFPKSHWILSWLAQKTLMTSQRKTASSPSRTGPGFSSTGSNGNAGERERSK